MLEAQQQSRLKAVKLGGTAAHVLSEPFPRQRWLGVSRYTPVRIQVS
jgi:hypothetical protein